MNSITINKSISHYTNTIANESKISNTNDKNTQKDLLNINSKITDNSNLSKESLLANQFLNRIENSKNQENTSFIKNYILEYGKIKNEIDSGVYGNANKKYMNLLNDAFSNALKLATTSMESTTHSFIKECYNSINPNDSEHNKIHLSSSNMKDYQKNIENASGLMWMLKSECKSLEEKISKYKKKKNHIMVISLTQTKNSFKQIMNNISDTMTLVQSSIDAPFNEDFYVFKK